MAENLDVSAPPSMASLAADWGMHPAYLARVYRAVMGEGLRDTIRRRRVERAVAALRATDWSAAEVALASGFCDQSHMNRAVKALTGRTPGEIRQQGLSKGDPSQGASTTDRLAA